ncbi:Uncharacterised protein [Kurthia zopfii]|nr:Uncharacterised protein [Kurthia zopfii]
MSRDLSERLSSRVECYLACSTTLFESLRKLGEKWWSFYFSFVSSSALESPEWKRFSILLPLQTLQYPRIWASIFHFSLSLFYAQFPFLKIGSIVPSGNTPSISISPLPTMKSSCVIDTLMPFASNSSSDNSLPPSKHVG